MTSRHRSIIAKIAVCALLATPSTEPLIALRPRAAGSIPTKTDVAWIGVAVAAIGAGIGLGIYFAVRPHHLEITGCAASGPNGPELVSEHDQKTYELVGEVASIKPGERIRVTGKKDKKTTGTHPQFRVEKLSKDLGACKAQAVMR
jgi:hypothetical protein